MALNDYISNYPGWQSAASTSAKMQRNFLAAQKEAQSVSGGPGDAAFDAAIEKLNSFKAARDAAKEKVDSIVAEATNKYNNKVNKSAIAKAQKDFDFIDSQIKRLEALGKAVPENFKTQRDTALAKLEAQPGYVSPSATSSQEGQSRKKKPKVKDAQKLLDFTNNLQTGGNVPGPTSSANNLSLPQEIAEMAAQVNNPDSQEFRATAALESGAGWTAFSSEVISGWKNQPSSRGVSNPYENKWTEIQTLLRETKKSKGTSPLGTVDASDLNGLKIAFQEAKAESAFLETSLNQRYNQMVANGTTASSSGIGGNGITKTLVSSLRLLDAGDASNKLSTAYYKAYGRYPTQKQISDFKDMWNKEARVQQAKGESYRAKGMSRDITTGEGFTDAEQADFLNRYLAKNFKMDVTKLGGDTKLIYDDIRSIYRDNFLPEPEFQQVAGIVKDLLGTADANVYNTKKQKLQETVGKQAAAFYPGIKEGLLNGDTVETYASVYRGTLAAKWGVSAASLKYDKEAQDLIKSAVNYKFKDGDARLMDNNEFNSLVQSTKRWKASKEAFNSYSDIGDKLISAFNLQGGVN